MQLDKRRKACLAVLATKLPCGCLYHRSDLDSTYLKTYRHALSSGVCQKYLESVFKTPSMTAKPPNTYGKWENYKQPANTAKQILDASAERIHTVPSYNSSIMKESRGSLSQQLLKKVSRLTEKSPQSGTSSRKALVFIDRMGDSTTTCFFPREGVTAFRVRAESRVVMRGIVLLPVQDWHGQSSLGLRVFVLAGEEIEFVEQFSYSKNQQRILLEFGSPVILGRQQKTVGVVNLSGGVTFQGGGEQATRLLEVGGSELDQLPCSIVKAVVVEEEGLC